MFSLSEWKLNCWCGLVAVGGQVSVLQPPVLCLLSPLCSLCPPQAPWCTSCLTTGPGISLSVTWRRWCCRWWWPALRAGRGSVTWLCWPMTTWWTGTKSIPPRWERSTLRVRGCRWPVYTQMNPQVFCSSSFCRRQHFLRLLLTQREPQISLQMTTRTCVLERGVMERYPQQMRQKFWNLNYSFLQIKMTCKALCQNNPTIIKSAFYNEMCE